MKKQHYLPYILFVGLLPFLLASEAPPTAPPAVLAGKASGLAFPLSNATSPAQTAASATTISGQDWVSQTGSQNSAGRSAGAYAIRPGGEEDLAYAMFTAGAMSINRPTNIDFNVSPAAISPGGEDDLLLKYWIGVSNYSDYGWEWRGPYASAQSFTLNCATNNNRYISAAGNFSFVVLCDRTDGACGAEIGSCTISSLPCSNGAYFSTKPHAAPLLAAVQSGPLAVTLNWGHIVDPHNLGANSATSYQVYRKQTGDSSTLLIGTVVAPAAQFVDPGNSVAGTPPLQANASYTYYLRAVNAAGSTVLGAWPVLTVH